MMSLLWRKTPLSSREDVVREIIIKNNLTQGLGTAVKALQQEHVNSNESIYSGDIANNICHYLEAIFIHGLKDTFFEKMSAILTNSLDRSPDPNFWPFLMVFSHKDIISQINNLSQITTDIGRCRAWIRAALNDGLLESYLAAMLLDKGTVEYYYKHTAYLRDMEQPDIMRKYIEGLVSFQFKLACNSHMLNMWTTTPLFLSGIWNPPVAPEPVVTGIDVASCYDDNGKPVTPDRKKKTRGRLRLKEIGTVETVQGMEIKQKPGSELESESSSLASCPDPIPPLSDLDYDDKLNLVLNIENDYPLQMNQNQTFMVEEPRVAEETESKNDDDDDDDVKETMCEIPLECDNDAATIEDSGFYMDDTSTGSPNQNMGNSLIGKTGWSSSFDEGEEQKCYSSPIQKDDVATLNAKDESFNTLLQNYSPLNSSVIRTPDFNDVLLNLNIVNADTVNSQSDTQTSIIISSPSPSVDETDFEIVPKSCSFRSSNADERTQCLLAVVGKICNEVGMDVQHYQCKACGRPIGMIYGKARVCSYDGYSYCYECHENDEYVIPARVVHNWDFRKYKVAKHTKHFLQQIEDEPLIDIRQTNSMLYSISEEMNELQRLRTQLNYLRSYLFTCRESVAEEMRRKLWPKEHLYEHIHLYSLSDLMQVPTRELAHDLQKIVGFAMKHVYSCGLCTQKGFICEICSNPKEIYPFELDTTYRCEKCLAVYHSNCMNGSKPCPKCERRKKREDHEDFACNPDE